MSTFNDQNRRSIGRLEHVNISVTDPERLSALLQEILGWQIRWRGPSLKYGHSIHLASGPTPGDDYIAIYSGEHVRGEFAKGQPLNHIAFTIEDLDAAERIVVEAGLTPTDREEYEPGARFYFFDWDGIEYELVSYDA